MPGASSSPCTTSGGPGQKICGTFLVLSDALGDLTGSYIDTNGTIHGYLRPTGTGIFTSFEDPNAYTSGSLNGTLGIAINSLTSGTEIAGTYIDTNSVLHGFIYTPSLTSTTTTLTPAAHAESLGLSGACHLDCGRLFQRWRHTCERRERHIHERRDLAGNGAIDKRRSQPDDYGASGRHGLHHRGLWRRFQLCGQHLGGRQPDGQQGQLIYNIEFVRSILRTSGQSVTLTANISGQFSGVATGTVTFSNGSTSLGSCAREQQHGVVERPRLCLLARTRLRLSIAATRTSPAARRAR